jgi:hypothetical protein
MWQKSFSLPEKLSGENADVHPFQEKIKQAGVQSLC